jgi:hypothetical protein
MTIIRVQDAPCWVATVPPEGDELHYATRNAAIAAAVEMTPGAVVTRLPVHCFWVECDRCYYREGESENGIGHHLPAFEPWHVLGDLGDLERVGTDLLCEACRGVDPITQLAIPPALAALVDQAAGR